MKGEKLIAVLMTAILTLSPLAMAAVKLGDYPTFLFKNHNLDAYVVVGADAKPEDVVGAVDLAVRLAGESYEEVSASGSLSLTGAVTEDIPLGSTVAGGTGLDSPLKKYKLTGLLDDTLTFQDDNYDYHEEIILSTSSDNLDLETSLTKSDFDMGSNVYLLASKKSLKYAFVFDDAINVSLATADEPLEIDFLGKTLVIESVPDDSSFTVRVGDQHTLSVDQSVKVLGKTVTLKNVFSSGSVLVDVDGVSATVNSGATKTINGVKVKPIETAYSDTKGERVAVLLIGSETTKTYSDTDPYIGEDKNYPNWIWNLAGLRSSTSPTIQIENEFVKDSYSKTPITVGGCYNFPNEYAKVCLDSLTVTDLQEYTFKADTGVDLSNAGGSTTNKVLTLNTPGEDEGLQLTPNVDASEHKTDTIYLKSNTSGSAGYVTVYYTDSNNKVQLAGAVALDKDYYKEFAQVNYRDTRGGDIYFSLKGNVTSGTVYLRVNNTLSGMTSDYLVMSWTTVGGEFDHLGSSSTTSEDTELVFSGSVNIGKKDDDMRTPYGVVVKNPDSNGGYDKVVLEIPADQVKGKVVVYGPGGTSTTTEGGKIKKVVPITEAVAKLDTEISDPATVGKNLVLVGGPAVNRLTAQAMGLSYPTYGSSGQLPFASGEGYIEVKDGVFTSGQVVVIVAGWEAANTRMATSLLQQYSTFANELGSNTAVKVTSLSSSGITPA